MRVDGREDGASASLMAELVALAEATLKPLIALQYSDVCGEVCTWCVTLTQHWKNHLGHRESNKTIYIFFLTQE